MYANLYLEKQANELQAQIFKAKFLVDKAHGGAMRKKDTSAIASVLALFGCTTALDISSYAMLGVLWTEQVNENYAAYVAKNELALEIATEAGPYTVEWIEQKRSQKVDIAQPILEAMDRILVLIQERGHDWPSAVVDAARETCRKQGFKNQMELEARTESLEDVELQGAVSISVMTDVLW